MWLKILLISATMMVFTYGGYPLLAMILAKLLPRPPQKRPVQPRLSVILTVCDEGERVANKLENILAQDYPPELLEVILVDDGSTDSSVEELAPGLIERIHLTSLSRRRGKATAVNAGIKAAHGEVLVFTDARQWMCPGALRALAANFADHTVSAVTGALVNGAGGAEGAFRRYEESLRGWESAWGSTAGATGALYAVRRGAVDHIPPGTILDDLVISLSAARHGRLVHEPGAKVFEPPTAEVGTLSRRLRTLAGNWQLVFHPIRYRKVLTWSTAVQLLCHKGLRLGFPFFAAGFAIALCKLSPRAAIGSLISSLLALMVIWYVPGMRRLWRLAGMAASVVVLPLGALFRYLSGRETVLWARR